MRLFWHFLDRDLYGRAVNYKHFEQKNVAFDEKKIPILISSSLRAQTYFRQRQSTAGKPNIMSRHNVAYVEACSSDNALGDFIQGTKLNQYDSIPVRGLLL